MLFPELVTQVETQLEGGRALASGLSVEVQVKADQAPRSAEVALPHNGPALEILYTNRRDRIPGGLHQILIECLLYL